MFERSRVDSKAQDLPTAAISATPTTRWTVVNVFHGIKKTETAVTNFVKTLARGIGHAAVEFCRGHGVHFLWETGVFISKQVLSLTVN